MKVEQRLVDLDIAVKTSLHLERPTPEECITALDELNELALAPLMLKKQPDIVTTIRFVNHHETSLSATDHVTLSHQTTTKLFTDVFAGDSASTLAPRTTAAGRTRRPRTRWRRMSK